MGTSSQNPLPSRKSWEASCEFLVARGLVDPATSLRLPDRSPRFDDEPHGVSFFRTQLRGLALDHLSLPRTFLCRSEIVNVSFRATNLSESTVNWNDFHDVDFSAADLSRSDLRASVFERVRFDGALLHGADLRHARFAACSFAEADLTGAKVARTALTPMGLSPQQVSSLLLSDSAGPEPEGG